MIRIFVISSGDLDFDCMQLLESVHFLVTFDKQFKS